MDWLHELPLNEQAAAVRRTLSLPELKNLQSAIENLAMVTNRPIVEVANELLISTQEMAGGDGTDRFMGLLDGIISENEGQ